MKTKMRYHPLTATPFKRNSAYKEIGPCQALQPYIRCFWGGEYDCSSDTGTDESSEIVIPDTCVDIIYRINDVGNIVTSDYVGINDRAFLSHKSQKAGYKISVFAIRFYAWTAYVFSEDSFAGTVNGRYDVRERYSWLDRELRGRLTKPENLTDLIRLTESLLLKKLETARINKLVDGVMNDILLHQGALEINQLSKKNFISSRQMERLFCEYVGMAPKKLSNLVRYQYLWKDIVSHNNLDIASAVSKYGYTDLPHMMREFKRYHSMNIREAREMALR
ncbi:MAG: helix-turn-helix domain-containing protein [bacterium]|nr:helix-turn-helix domain-containing protein [bacterium]